MSLPDVPEPPGRFGVGATVQARRLLAADGTVVFAEHIRSDAGSQSGLAIVVVHGFTMNSRRPIVRRVAAWLHHYADVVMVDLRGHGRSGGHSTLGLTEVLDVDAAVAWAYALGYRRVATAGFSLGSAVVLRHAALHGDVGAVVAVSGPGEWYYRGSANMRVLHRLVLTRAGRATLRLARGTRVTPAGWSQPYPLDPPGAAAEIGVPLLVIHGDRDTYFPVHHGWRIQAAARRATFWIERGFGHAEAAVTAGLATRMGEWLVEHALPVDEVAQPTRGAAWRA